MTTRSCTVAVLSVLLVVGCANSVYRTPGAESQSIGQLAIVEYRGVLGAGGVNVVEVDGRHRGVGFFRRYELSPGAHSMRVDLNVPGASTKSVTLNFVAAAGGLYEVKYEIRRTDAFGGTWRVWIEDAKSGQAVDSKQG